jgi:hypothetical protein
MTTHGIVGVYTNASRETWRAVRIRADAYPSGTGLALHLNYYHQFGRDLAKLIKRVVEEHPEGWVTIAGKNLMLPAATFLDKAAWELSRLSRSFEKAAFETQDEEESRSFRYLSAVLDTIPIKYEKPEHSIEGQITHATSDEDYWAEWSYLFDLSTKTADVFWGHPSDIARCTIWLEDLPTPALWDRVQTLLPDLDTSE